MEYRYLIFTDLDGCLLDPYSYKMGKAEALAKQLLSQGHKVIPCSSKTHDEVMQIQYELSSYEPFVIENGAAIYTPDSNPPALIKQFARPIYEHKKLISDLMKSVSKSSYITFSEASPEQLKTELNLPEQYAVNAKSRMFTETIIWKNNSKSKRDLINKLSKMGLQGQQGGRCISISTPCNKADAMLWLINFYQQKCPKVNFISIAIGDSENDREMLEAADFSVLVKSSNAHNQIKLKRNDENHIITSSIGPEGWCEGILKVLERIKSQYVCDELRSNND